MAYFAPPPNTIRVKDVFSLYCVVELRCRAVCERTNDVKSVKPETQLRASAQLSYLINIITYCVSQRARTIRIDYVQYDDLVQQY